MKDGFYNLHERLFSQFWDMILSSFVTLKIKMFGEIEICDGLCNCLLCAIQIHCFSMFITYPK
jgi:hypothetical protein